MSDLVADRAHHDRQPVGRLLDWITTTNHKTIGLLYIGASLIFFLAGGIMAELIRTELATPSLTFLSKQGYNELFTIHGTVMIFLFVAPIGLGFANYFVPLQIGAPDMAFPRMNALRPRGGPPTCRCRGSRRAPGPDRTCGSWPSCSPRSRRSSRP
jgi:hypothetical protein